MNVKIFGPNLNDQSKGTFHVHADGCAHEKFYGPGKKFGGEREAMPVKIASCFEASQFIYADHACDNNVEGSPEYIEYLEDAISDFYFAPCTKGLPYR